MKIFMKTTIALALASGIGAAQACSTAQWAAGGTATAKSVVAGSTRYEGLCALEAQSGQKVEQTIAGSGDTYFRFYVFADSAQTADVKIFSAESGGSEIAALSLGSGNTLKIGTQSATLDATKWSQVQLQVNAGSANVWVNDTQVLTGVTVGAGNVDKISLGSLGGTQTGNIYFDAFVASNGQAVGDDGVSIGSDKQLVPGDANGNGVYDAFDVVLIRREILSKGSASFQPSDAVPDCDVNGSVGSFDVVCVRRNILLP